MASTISRLARTAKRSSTRKAGSKVAAKASQQNASRASKLGTQATKATSSAQYPLSTFVDQEAIGKRIAQQNGGANFTMPGGSSKSKSVINKAMNADRVNDVDKARRQATRSNVSRSIGTNFSDAGWKGTAVNMGSRALAGAGIGAATGGAMAAASGDDFWDGAGLGAVRGALGGAGVGAVRTAVGAQKGQNVFNATGAFANKTGVSKQVEALMKMNREAAKSPTKM